MPARYLMVLSIALVCAVGLVQPANSQSSGYRVIVNPANHVTTVSRKFLADAFLKKSARWGGNGETIRPADLTPDSHVRRRFSEEVLNKSVAAVKNYWQQVIFSGRNVPPPEFGSDEDVVSYVLKHAGGVGYVSSNANVGSAKIVTIK